MDYLKEFISDEEYNQFLLGIDEEKEVLFLTHESEVRKMLQYFQTLDFNLMDILLYKSTLLFDNVEFVKQKIQENSDLLPSIREDVCTFDLIGL